MKGNGERDADVDVEPMMGVQEDHLVSVKDPLAEQTALLESRQEYAVPGEVKEILAKPTPSSIPSEVEARDFDEFK